MGHFIRDCHRNKGKHAVKKVDDSGDPGQDQPDHGGQTEDPFSPAFASSK